MSDNPPIPVDGSGVTPKAFNFRIRETREILNEAAKKHDHFRMFREEIAKCNGFGQMLRPDVIPTAEDFGQASDAMMRIGQEVTRRERSGPTTEEVVRHANERYRKERMERDALTRELIDAMRELTAAMNRDVASRERDIASRDANTLAIEKAWEINDGADAWKQEGDPGDA